ncbi:MAG: hypothetical protein JXR35_03995 [Rhodobacteraceae bacterium]|nr:hypothetical protein [Paracoccaceae bacterium]
MGGLLKVAAIAPAGFWRASQFWPHEGVTVDPDDLDDGVLERLEAEPMLRITPLEAGEQPGSLDDGQLVEAIKGVIATLEAGDFGKDGSPKLAAIKERLPDEKDRLTAELRDQVWATIKPAD